MVRPDELIFNQVGVNQAYSQVLTMQNTLSAPVELVSQSFVSSNLFLDHFYFFKGSEKFKSGKT